MMKRLNKFLIIKGYPQLLQRDILKIKKIKIKPSSIRDRLELKEMLEKAL
jgi:hypothetical protein